VLVERAADSLHDAAARLLLTSLGLMTRPQSSTHHNLEELHEAGGRGSTSREQPWAPLLKTKA